MKQLILAVWMCGISAVASAQEKNEKMEPDRPGETATPVITAPHFFQAELGFFKENSGDDYTIQHPDFLLKYGLLKKVELRLQGDFITDYKHLIPNPETTSGLQPVEIGGKLSLLEGKGIVPQTAFIAQVGLPFLSSAAFRTPHLVPSFRAVLQNKITEKFSLGYNVGAEWDGESTVPSWLYTVAPAVELGEKWNAFVEVYGFVKKAELPEHSLDAGVAYALSENTRLDLSGGVGLSEKAPDQFIMLGFSFRVPVSKKIVH